MTEPNSRSILARDVWLCESRRFAGPETRRVDVLPRGRCEMALRGGRWFWVGGVCPVSLEGVAVRSRGVSVGEVFCSGRGEEAGA